MKMFSIASSSQSRFALFMGMMWLVLGLLIAPAAQAYQTVILDPGHGGADPGAYWYRIKEKDLTLDVAKRVEILLQKNGRRAVLTRRTDKTMTLSQRAALANKYPRALFVSIHFNASLKTSIKGHESFYCSASGRKVAVSIQKHMQDFVQSSNRGVRHRQFSVLRKTSATAVLVECAFISNRAEAQKCLSPAYRQKLALGIARGILRTR